MKEIIQKRILGKNIRIILKINNNPIYYSGKVLAVDKTSILILDKFKQEILISNDSIVQLTLIGGLTK